MVKDKAERIIEARKRLAQRVPDPTLALAGSLMKRMIRCNKPGCQYCEKGKGKGHGPIWILSVSAGNRRARQIPVPAHLKQEVEEGLRRYAEIQKWAETDRKSEPESAGGTQEALRRCFLLMRMSFITLVKDTGRPYA